ncbi:hypothetical protein AB0912_29560 [Streptomyces sp. NPDC007084]
MRTTAFRGPIEERTGEAELYDAHGRHDAAVRLRDEADVLRAYLTD